MTRLALTTALTLQACNIEGNVGGLADTLLDPEPSSIDSPGRQIAKGEYSSLELDASLSVGARLLALRHDREQSELAIIPFEGGKACHVGPATRFMRLASQVDIDLPPLVAVLNEVQNGRGSLRFVDFSCEDVMPELEDVSLPQVLYPRSDPTGFLVLNGSGAIYFLNVIEHEVSTVSESVRSGRVGSEHLWLVENGELHARDDNFDIAASYGSEIQDFALFSGLSERGVTDVAYIEGGNLFLASDLDGEPQQLAENVCALTDIGHAGAFAFYSPCDTRRLSIAYKSSLVGLQDDAVLVTQLAEQVLDLRQIDLYWGDGYGTALFLTNADPAADRGTLQMQGFNAETGEVDDAKELKENARISTGGVIRIDYSGSSGTLVRAKIEESDAGRPELISLDPLAEGVAQLPGLTVSSSLGVLANYSDAELTGDLLLFSNDLEQAPSVLVGGVPIQRHVRDGSRQRSAFVADFNGETGTAYILDGNKATPLGRNVQPGTLRFLEMPNAVAYLADPGGARGNLLTLYLLDAELEVRVNAEVTEFHGLPWPSPGILYSVAPGDDQGIWFARAR